MPLASMTGFARAQGHCEGLAWTLEARSVNGKSLDVRCRMPAVGRAGADRLRRRRQNGQGQFR